MAAQPYGTWASPLAAADLFGGVAAPASLQVDGDDLWWVEARPSEGGRQALVRWRDGDGLAEATPADWNCRTRVQEYGGAPFAVRDGVVVGASRDDQRWWRLDGDRPVPLTPRPEVDAGLRLADARFVPGRDVVVAVRERHDEDGGEPSNEVVLVGVPHPGEVDPRAGNARDGDTVGTTTVLVTGRDFVAAPRPSPDGRWLCWLAWDHPHMPWDAAELWVARLDGDRLLDARRVAGGADRSACSPVWAGDDELLLAEERDGWWQPVLLDLGAPDGRGERTWDVAALVGADGGVEVGGPLWRFGAQDLAVLADGRQAWVVVEQASARLVVVPSPASTATPSDVEVVPASTRVRELRAWRDGVAWLGVEADGTTVVATWTPADGRRDVVRRGVDGLRDADVPEVRHVSYPTPDGATTHAFLHLPANADATAQGDERPPLLVFIHGGPTSDADAVSGRQHVFWTTRGFAVADVNYRGSTGYGQAYRNALLGRWGETDVLDVVAVAEGLAADGLVDGARMAIRGGSAGGFTAMAALTTPEQPFACGTSFYGVADLRLLAEHTHKFEARYLDRLVGPLPEAAAAYAERSPLSRTEHLAVPLLVLQGSDDRVVPPEQSRAMVAAAAERGLPHAYVEFDGEGHGFRELDNLVRWHEAELAFYGEVMGFTPAGDLPEVLGDG